MLAHRISCPAILAIVLTAVAPVGAVLNVDDPSIITHLKLNEQSSGQLDNSVNMSFLDTAPTGTPQNHDDFNDGASNGPQWGSGAAYTSGGNPVGDGIGLGFSRADDDRTRFQPWMNASQGNYTNGKSFTVMVRVNPTTLADNTAYNVLGIGSHFIQLEGVSGGGQGRVDVQLRDGGVGGDSAETFWNHDSFSGSGDTIMVPVNTWTNLFLIYEANTRITIATDDGSVFKQATSNTVPAGFDSLIEGFSDAGVHWNIGSLTTAAGSYDGLLESVVIWDRALSNAEADFVGFQNVPEPGALGVLALAGMLLCRRSRSN